MEIECGNPECDIRFVPKCWNGKYCSPECRTKVMNKRILDRYYEKKEIKSGKVQRVCSVKECETILSKYNSETICEAHQKRRFEKRLKKWGWTEEDISNMALEL